MTGIQHWFSLRMINEEGLMSKDKMQVRRYSCCCSGCLTGGDCLANDGYNSWSTVGMILKPILEPVIKLFLYNKFCIFRHKIHFVTSFYKINHGPS